MLSLISMLIELKELNLDIWSTIDEAQFLYEVNEIIYLIWCYTYECYYLV